MKLDSMLTSIDKFNNPFYRKIKTNMTLFYNARNNLLFYFIHTEVLFCISFKPIK